MPANVTYIGSQQQLDEEIGAQTRNIIFCRTVLNKQYTTTALIVEHMNEPIASSKMDVIKSYQLTTTRHLWS